jgi:Fungalysin metallopeptidase (M36)/IgGFc binding protein/Bacterial Ig domain/K319L-like, PKD domain/Fungalysin/Thermolysin Propeptide Motif/Fibronectin type III domain
LFCGAKNLGGFSSVMKASLNNLVVFVSVCLGTCGVKAQTVQTNLAVVVRHAPRLNGGTIQGSLQQLSGESVTINGGFVMTGDLLVPGTPTLVLNGHPVCAGMIAGSGSTSPSGYQIILNGNCSLNYLRARTKPNSLPSVSAPPTPTGTRSVSINKAGQSYGDPTTLRSLTLNGNVGMVSVPPGTYGNFTANGGSGLVLGVAGGGQAVSYNLQNLTLNGNSTLKVVGPVVLTVANGFAANGNVGASNNPAWLQLQVANGSFTLNGGCNIYGLVAVPSGTVIVNGNSALVGTSASDRFILNGGGQVCWSEAAQIIQPPVATNQSITLPENSSTNITLTGSDPQGLTLTYTVLTQPIHGTLTGTPPNLTYQPSTNFHGSDSFTFKVNNGVADSAPATIPLTVTQVYYPPVANPQNLTNPENNALAITLTGSDSQGYALTYAVLTQPAHGTLSGRAPNLTYLPATNYWGGDSFTFQVNDGVSNSAAATISITNQPVDQPPLAVAGPNQIIILPANLVSLAGSVTYANFPGTVDIVQWSKVSGPGDVAFSNPANPITTATFSTNGIYVLQLFASDSFLSASNSLSVTVDAPPVISAGPTTTNTFPGTVTLQGAASDDGLPTNGTLTVQWSKVSGSGTVVFDDAAATNTSVTFSTNGTYVLHLTADDGVATNYSEVTIIENLPPTVSAGNDILTNGLQGVLNGSVSDDDLPGGVLTVLWSQSSGPSTVSFADPAATNTTVTSSHSGTYVLTLTASDGAATNSAEATVTFNLPPVVNAGPLQTVNFGDTVTLQGSITDDQLPHNILNTIWSEVSGSGTATFADPTVTNTTVTFDQPGIYTLRLTADDGMATNSADTVITINAAPVVSAGPDQTVTLGAPVTLAGTVTDDGIPGPIVTTEWTQASGPTSAIIADATALTSSVSFSEAGVYVFQLTANDRMTHSSAQVTITVVPAPSVNHPPVAQSQTLGTVTNTPVNITMTAADADNDPLTFQVLTRPADGTLSGNAPNLIYQPSVGFIGTDIFTFVANDGHTNSAPATVSINVQAPTNSLQLIVPAAQNVLQDTSFTFANGNQIAIAGGTAGANPLLLSLSVTNGTLTLAATNGLTMVSGADGTSNLMVSGSQNDLNNALDGLIYLGNPFFVGTDTIMAAVQQTDGSGASDSKTVPLTVLPILTFVGPLTGAIEQIPFSITYDDMYWNSDIGDGVSFPVESLTTGSLTKNGNPLEYGTTLISPGDSVVWIPPAGAMGVMDAFHVRAWDGTHLSSNDVPVYIEIVDRAPVAQPQSLITVQDTALNITLGATDADNDQLTYQVLTQPSHGTLTGDAPSLTYQPAAAFIGSDSFTFVANDGQVDSAPATVKIAVNVPPNNPPRISIVNPLDASQTQSGQAITIEASASDSDGQITNTTLFADGSIIASLTEPPFTTTWSGAALGKHVLTATATDNRGAVSAAADISIWVVDENGDFLVDAGPDQVISLPQSVSLLGAVNIRTPAAGSDTNVTWSKLDGPGEVQFSDPNTLTTTAQFNIAGSYILKLEVTYAAGTRSDLLKVDVLPQPPNRLTAAHSNRGTDFWLTKMYRGFSSSDVSSAWHILIAAETNTDVQIVSPQWDLINTETNYFQVKAGTIQTFPVYDPGDGFFWDDISGVIVNDSVHVVADAPVTVYGFVRDIASTDGYVTLPTSFLGTNYMVLSYYGASGFAIAATEDATTVTIVPTSDIDEDRLDGRPCQILLQRGQTFRTEKSWDGDFTGTSIVADKPIAVFSGGVGAYIPTNYAYFDDLIEQMTPVSAWGQHFATMPLATRLNGDTFRFLAGEDETRVSVNGEVVADLNRGQFYEHIITNSSIILATHPILVGQFANGTTYDGIMGDPFMMLVPPAEQFGGDYLLDAVSLNAIRNFWEDPNLDYASYMNLILLGGPTNTVLLNDTPVPVDQFQRIGDSDYFGAELAVSNVSYRISSSAPVGVCVYGWAPYESYAFMGGCFSDVIDSDLSLTLTQRTAYGAVGGTKSVAAHIVNKWGRPMPDLQVSFSVDGVNHITGQATTSRFGDAIFTWNSSTPGGDIVTANLGNYQQSLTNTWIYPSENTPPVVTTTNTPPLQFGLTIHLLGDVYDHEQSVGNGLSQHWELLSGIGDVSFDNVSNAETLATCSMPGIYQFALVADDLRFNTRSTVMVRVDGVPNINFSMDETAPLSVGSEIELSANASDADDGIDRVAFYINGVLAGLGTNDPTSYELYSMVWTPPASGWFTFQAIAFDHYGGAATSEVYAVQADYTPTVSIDSPSSGAVLTVPTNVLIHATANDADGTIASLSIYANGQLLATTNGPSLTMIWFPQYQGDYDLTAVAVDNLGLSTTSADVPVTVAGDFPQVTIINNYTNQYGNGSIRIPLGEPALLQADVSIPGPHQITNVSFCVWNVYTGTRLVGSISEPPYQIIWTPENDYDWQLYVVAEADSGAIGEATGFLGYYRDVSIAFAYPAMNQTVLVGKPVPLQLTVHDPGHLMGMYDYYINGQLLIETTNSTVSWQPSAAGNYVINVQAYDLYYGKSAQPFAASITVTAINPSIENVAIFSPTDGEESYAGVSLPIAVDFTDSAAIFDHLEVFTNGVSLGTTPNTFFDWTPTQTNDYTLTATVFDVFSNAYNAANSVTVHIIPPPRPVITITSPADGSRVQANAETLITASLTDPASLTTNVQFHVDGVEVSNNTVSCGWTPTQLGGHVLQALALTSDGDSITSAPVNVTVAVMYPPVVTLLSPTNGQRFPSDLQPLLQAQASDADGVISNLSLSLDSAVLGNTNGVQLEIVDTNIAPGWHEAAAQATDNDGLSSSSDSVSFYVDRREDLTLPAPDQLTAEAISAAEIRLTWQPVSTNGRAQSILIERWDAAQSLWTEIGETDVGHSGYTDSNLNPETNYRYRIACVDTNGVRSADSGEANATTRTVLPNYAVVDLSQAIAASLTNLATGANILTNAGLADFDSRRATPFDSQYVNTVLGTKAAPLLQAVARFKEQWPQIQLDYDPVLLSPKSVLPRLGFLTGPYGSGITVSDATAQMFDPNDPYRPVKAFIQEYRDLFGFGPEAITNAMVRRDYVSPATGTHTLVWQQQVAGIPVFNAIFAGNITANGELASVASEFIPAPAAAADASVISQVLAGNSLPVSGAQAVLSAVTNVGDLFGPGDFGTQTDSQGVVRSQSFTTTRGFKQNASVELTWFPASRNELKLAWQVVFTSQWRGDMYLTLVSALDGQILYRRNLTADGSDAGYRVYTDASPAPMWPGLPTPGTAQAAFAYRSLLTFSALDTNASPNGWINDADNETRGNNVDAHLDRNDDDNPDLPRPTGNPWRTFDFSLDLASNPDSYGDAAVMQLFFWNNWMHDALYEFGFTESAGNFQNDNFGRGGLGGDAVQADAQDGYSLNDSQHRNNANMSTPPDGYAPRMQMYVFDGATPARDGSLDAEIILHEYTHGLSTRLVGGGAGIDAVQTAGLGEGWSDFYALSLLANPTNDVNATYPLGGYVAYHAFGSAFEENYYYGIRHYPYCTDTNKDPLTFADIDPSHALPHSGVPRSPLMGIFSAVQAGEVHNQGEVWCSMLWELRANLINKYGPESGNNLALQLVTDGMKLSPANPNFVQARDAILLADRIYSGGVNASEIWSAFAKRGLGYSAKAPESDTTTGAQGSSDLQPALAAERVEILSASGSIELGINNNVLIHLRNQGNATATHVSGHLSTTVTAVTVLQTDAAYTDIPSGAENVDAVAFQIQTGNDYVSGTPIDLTLTITSDQGAVANHLRLYTGVPGGEILFDDYNALAEPMSASPAPKDLTPWDICNAEPLWMADDATCLLKAGNGKYLLWKTDGTIQTIVNTNFLAHRLTRSGVVVGTLSSSNEVVTGCTTITNLQNVVMNVCYTNIIPHSEGAWWDFTQNKAAPLTSTQYQWPHNAGPIQPSGTIFSAVIPDQSGNAAFLTNIFTYPTLQDVWDMNSSGVAVGAVSFQGTFNQLLYFGTLGNMDWFTPTERSLDAGTGGSNLWTSVIFDALMTSAAKFNSPEDWRWLGPLNWNTATSYATLINNAGMVAGTAAVDLNDPNLNALRPTHAFRAPLSGECQPFASIITDLGALPGGLHSQPRAMNAEGDLVGYSDFDAMSTGGLNFSPYNSHAVYWGLTNTAPDLLTNFPPSTAAPYGFADACGINDSNQIVGASILANGQMAGVMWQWNNNTNGDPFWEITDLNQRLTDSSWQVFRAVDINNDGLILAHASDGTGIKHAVLLIPMAMAVDNNRDGNITFDDADKTTADKPYRFWLNDDQDESKSDWKWTEPEPEIYEEHPQHHDSDDQIINSPRDCEDLTRLWLDTGNLLNFLQNADNDLYLGLKWENVGDTKPSIRLFRSADTNGGLGHIKNATIAAKQASDFRSCLIDADYTSNGIDQVRPTDRVADLIFIKHTLADLNKSGSKLYLLFEGVAEGKGELRLVLLKKNRNGTWTSLGDGPGVWLDLKNIRRMYLRAYSTPLADNFPLPWERAATTHPPAYPYSEEDIPAMGNGALFIHDDKLGYRIGDSTSEDENQQDYPFDAPPDEQKKCVMFVHGIDLSVAEQQGYAQTFFKRLWWEGYRGRLVAFRWATTLDDGLLKPGHENTSLYNSGEYRSWKGGASLKKYVTKLHADLGNDWIISVAAHSLGNACTGEALKQGMQVNSYVAMEAAVSLSCYYSESDNPPTDPGMLQADAASPTPELASQLGYQGYLSDIGNTAFSRVSYFNADDFWLVTGSASRELAWWNVNWMADQKKYKPDDRRGLGEYDFESQFGNSRRPGFVRGLSYARWVEDPHEAMAFVARSRTRPLGAGEPPQTFSGLNLEDVYLFDWQRSCHSGQFQRDIQLMYGDKNGTQWPVPFYKRLMSDLNVSP